MKIDLDQQLSQLPRLERRKLLELWHELFGKAPQAGFRNEVLVRILAYRLQEKALGGLKPSTARRLKTLAEDFASGKKPSALAQVRLKAGNRIVREWQGRLHEVSVLAVGFEYDDRTYRSLSEIAREITGTRWSGPAFFGLKNRQSKRAA